MLKVLDMKQDAANARTGNRALRILMVAPQPFFRPRGTPFSVLHRIRALVEAGHQIDLVTYPFGEDIEMPGLRILRAARPPFVRDVKIGPSVAKIALDGPLYLRTVRALRHGTYDILHTHEEAAFFGVGLAKRHGLIHIYDMHSSLPHQLSNFKAFDLGLFRKMFEHLERRVLATCDGVITICDDLARIAKPMCGDTPHAMIENTGDDARIFGDDGRDVRAELGLEGRRVFLYTGTFEAYQGIDLLLDAFARVVASKPDAHLLLVGGRPNQIEETRARTVALGIGDAVTFTGSVHPSRIPGLLAVSDVITSPRTRGTNTPLKIYGYLRTGKPLVATDLFTHTQFLTPEVSLLAPATAEGFAAGMERLLDEPELAARLADSGRTFMDAQHSDDDYVKSVLRFYESVLARA
jgi:glycosyltransferase involved in cell wall biosynthesis